MLKVFNITQIGALTCKATAFKARSWEEQKTISTDILNSLGNRIVVLKNNLLIKGIKPLKNFLFNIQRFNFENYQKWKIIVPLKKEKKYWKAISWKNSFNYFNLKIWFYSFNFKIKNLIIYTNFLIDKECVITLKLITKLMGFTIYQNKKFKLNNFYLWYLNPNIYKEINKKKNYVFVGLNMRLENPILNIKFRLLNIKKKINIGLIGSNYNNNFNSILIGLTTLNLLKLLKGKNVYCIKLKKKQNITIIVGNNLLMRLDGKNLLNYLKQKKSRKKKNYFNKNLTLKWIKNYKKKRIYKKIIKNKTNIIYLNLSYYLIEELNINNNINNINNNIKNIKNNIYIILGLEKIKIKKTKKNFIVFQGSNINLKELNILAIDLIWPSLNIFEKSSNYLNMEGKTKKTIKIKETMGLCYNDWYILNALYLHIMYFTVELYKSYKFSKNKKLPNFYYRRFFTNLTKKTMISFYIKKLSINFYFKELSKYMLYAYNKKNKFVIKKKNYKIYNNIIKIIKYNPYKTYKEYSRTLKNCSIQLEKWIKNYI